MNKLSSKFLSMEVAKAFIDTVQKDESYSINGILLLTSFGIVYGKFHEFTNLEVNNTPADILLNTKSTQYDKLISENQEIFGDGSTITLNDAIVKYSSGITLNMEEIIIFCDQIIGYYPVDLKTFEQLQK